MAGQEAVRVVRPIRVAVLASGSGTNLQAILDAVDARTLDAEVVLVFSDKREAHALARAAKAGVPTEVSGATSKDREAYDRQASALILKYTPDVLVFAGYMRIVTKAFVERFPDRIINIHPALLPAFPGMHAQRQALDAGVKVTGCTTHFVRAEVDAGPIILQACVPVEEGDTEATLAARILGEEHKLLPRTVQLFAEGRLKVEGRRVRVLQGSK